MVRCKLQLLVLVIVAISMSCQAIALPVLSGCIEPAAPKFGIKYCALHKYHLVCAGKCLSGSTTSTTLKCNLETGQWIDNKNAFPDCADESTSVFQRIKRSVEAQDKPISSFSGENQPQAADRIEASGAIQASGAIESSGAIQASVEKQTPTSDTTTTVPSASSIPSFSGEQPQPADRIEVSGAIQTSGDGQKTSTDKLLIEDQTTSARFAPKDRLSISGEQPVSSGESAS